MPLKSLSILLASLVFMAMTAVANAATINVDTFATATNAPSEHCGPNTGPSCSSTSINTASGTFAQGVSATSSAFADIATGELKVITSATYGVNAGAGTGSGSALAEITETGITAMGAGTVTAFLDVDVSWDLFSLTAAPVDPRIAAYIHLDGVQQPGGLSLNPDTNPDSINQTIEATFSVFDGQVFDLKFGILAQLLHGEGSVDGFNTATIFIATSQNLTLDYLDDDFLSDPAFSQAVVPLPAALPLLAGGLGLMGLLGWRRKRKAA